MVSLCDDFVVEGSIVASDFHCRRGPDYQGI